jgi:hypothetical protein
MRNATRKYLAYGSEAAQWTEAIGPIAADQCICLRAKILSLSVWLKWYALRFRMLHQSIKLGDAFF